MVDLASMTGVVLAGGASRRMGRDKRGLAVGGVPLLRAAVDAVGSVASGVLVVESLSRPGDPAWLQGAAVRIVRDRREGGPLAGLEAGLEEVATEWAMVVASDMPWLHPEVLWLLATTALAAEPSVEIVALESATGAAEPLPAAYRQRVVGQVRRNLDAGRLRMLDLLADVPVELVGRRRWLDVDPAGRTVRSVNRPQDLPAS